MQDAAFDVVPAESATPSHAFGMYESLRTSYSVDVRHFSAGLVAPWISSLVHSSPFTILNHLVTVASNLCDAC